MSRTLILFVALMMFACNANDSLINKLNPEFENIYFDVVEKKIFVQPTLPKNVEKLVFKWFDDKIKLNGFDGNIEFLVTNYTQELSVINEGKRVDISLSFEVILSKPNPLQKKIIKGKVSSYGDMIGNFSLDEFDTMIQNTQSDLILRLSRDLKSKI
tara:strand:+ start:2506 stop:2976 length:471 start_codon:yes stop_codon:yes gene_type:complete